MPQVKRKHSVIVGNIGTVVQDGTWTDAKDAFEVYRLQSKENYGRASGEDVTWFVDGEIYREYIGTITRRENKDA